jgi:hypothetical protein
LDWWGWLRLWKALRLEVDAAWRAGIASGFVCGGD